MYRKILVPLDGSKRAEKILPHVQAMAKAGKAQVVLLQVISPGAPEFIDPVSPFGTPVNMQPYFEALEGAEAGAKEYLAEKAKSLKGIKATGRVERGETVRTIIRVAGEEKAELVAMASHGRTGLARVFYGSVANGVLHQIDRPLLLIRAETEH